MAPSMSAFRGSCACAPCEPWVGEHSEARFVRAGRRGGCWVSYNRNGNYKQRALFPILIKVTRCAFPVFFLFYRRVLCLVEIKPNLLEPPICPQHCGLFTIHGRPGSRLLWSWVYQIYRQSTPPSLARVPTSPMRRPVHSILATPARRARVRH